jgi:hypothetical protein
MADASSWWADFAAFLAPLLAVLVPLAGVPLAAFTFYLRAMKDSRQTWEQAWSRRLDAVETGLKELRQAIREFERDYTTKEEWLRECMYARRGLEQISTATVGEREGIAHVQ